MSLLRTFFPLPCQYLTMKIDFVAMVRLLEDVDDEARAAAETLAQEGKTYLVFIRSNYEPPLGWDEAAGYSVDIVARGPRLPDTTRGFTSDMFVPVYPFTHPEHQSVRPERVLPFPDCAHWLDSMVDVAVQRVSEGLDNSKACELPPIQIPLIERAYAKQWTRFAASERRKNLTAKSRSAPPASCGPSDSSPTHDASSAPNAPRPGGPEALEGDPYTNEFVPLVNVGVEIDQRFAGLDKLPTVYDFFQECEKIKQILNAAFERRALSTTEHSDSGTHRDSDVMTRLQLPPS